MKSVLFGLLAATVTVAATTALQAGGPAYPDNWNGGAPLPPIGQGNVYYGTAQTFQPQQVYVSPQVAYVTPQVTYHVRENRVRQSDFFWAPEFHPFGPYDDYVDQHVVTVQPRVTSVQPQIVYVQQPQRYVTKTYSYQVLVPVND